MVELSCTAVCYRCISGPSLLRSYPVALEGVCHCPSLGWLGYWEGHGGFYGYWSFNKGSKILLGAMLDSSFKWLFMENSL